MCVCVCVLLAVQVRYVRFFRYFFANNVFVIALLALALLSAIYLVRRREGVENTNPLKGVPEAYLCTCVLLPS